jgi:lipid-A-disaccharide synthase-like uncharacterized protein
MNNYWIIAIGFIAQALFAARLIVQWIKSEKAGRVLSPTLFWHLSLVASFLLIIYGVLRKDIVIIGGQVFSYFIYIRNLRFKKAWRYIPHWFRLSTVAVPVVSMLYLFFDSDFSVSALFHNPGISIPLLTWGTAGQIIFTFRFVYQWIHSEKLHKSVLPPGFWWISLIGSVMVLIYAVFRYDPVLFLGQVFGTVVYGRNLYLHFRSAPSRSEKKPMDKLIKK